MTAIHSHKSSTRVLPDMTAIHSHKSSTDLCTGQRDEKYGCKPSNTGISEARLSDMMDWYNSAL